MTEKELDEKLKNIDFSDCKIGYTPGTVSQDPQQQNNTSLDSLPGSAADQQQKPQTKQNKSKSGTKKAAAEKKIETRGRKNRGLTKLANDIRNNELKAFRAIKQPDDFNNDLIEHYTGEIVNDNNVNEFKELFKLTCDSVLSDFVQNNPALATKHPYNYYKKLLIGIKQNTPKILPTDLDKCVAVWEVLSDFMDSIGLYMTYETFEKVTSIYRYQLKKQCELSPKYAAFNEKINNDCTSALVNEIQYNPYNATNKIFIAKVHGIIEKSEPKQIEVHHDIRNYNNLPMFEKNTNENT